MYLPFHLLPVPPLILEKFASRSSRPPHKLLFSHSSLMESERKLHLWLWCRGAPHRFCIVAPQDYSVSTDKDLSPSCDYGELQYNGVVCQWEHFCTFVWNFQAFVKYYEWTYGVRENLKSARLRLFKLRTGNRRGVTYSRRFDLGPTFHRHPQLEA